MKKFVVDEKRTVFADLTEISGISANNTDVNILFKSNIACPTVYTGNSHADAVDFAKKLAAEVDAAKSGKAIPAKDFSVTEKTTENKVADNDALMMMVINLLMIAANITPTK